MIRCTVLGLVAAFFAVAALASDEGFTRLFNGKDLAGWTQYLDKNADPAKTWSIADGVIRCAGTPMGYLITEKDYGDYVLRFQWRWPDKPGNSGAFVHVSGPNKIWPKGVEAQLMSGAAGDFWLVDGFKLTIPESQHDPKSPRHYLRTGETWNKSKDSEGRDVFKDVRTPVEKPLGEWNQYEIECRGNEVRLTVNGQLVNVGANAEDTKGKILLQSEGTPIEFRNIEIKSLK